MLLFTTDNISGREYDAIGLVKGNCVQSKHIGRDIGAGLKGIVGGEIKGYTELLTESRTMATERMVQEAEALGADAIVGIRFTTSQIMEGASEVLAYGTAVKLK